MTGPRRTGWARAGLALAALLAAGVAGAKPLGLVATLPPYAMLAEAVAGDGAEVHLLVRRGHDPHHYEPGSRDRARLESADLVVHNGLGRQHVEQVVRDAGVSRFAVADVVDFEPVRDDSGATNGHIWLDPTIMTAAADALAERLAELRPDSAADFRERAEAFRRAVEAADGDVRQRLDDLPVRQVVTYHPGFDYFFRHYDLEVAGTYLDLRGNEPGPRQVTELIRTLRESGIPALFGEPQLPADPIRALADEAGVAVAELDPLGFTESVATYPELLRLNARRIAEAYDG
ncbi:MAG: metal ABC transporter substrate-binding protein [Thiohalospira sp.]